MAARSASSGTPVKSCSTTRATTNGISSVRSAVGPQLASCFTCSSVTFLPSQLRSTDSSTTRIDTGRREILAPRACSSAGREYSLPLVLPEIGKSLSVLKVLLDITSPSGGRHHLLIGVLLFLLHCSLPQRYMCALGASGAAGTAPADVAGAAGATGAAASMTAGASTGFSCSALRHSLASWRFFLESSSMPLAGM